VRVEPGLANLSASYVTLVAKMNAGLSAAGFSVRTTAVASLYEPRLLWARSDGSTEGLAAALTTAAHGASSAPTACSTYALTTLGERLSSTWAESGNSSSAPFAQERGALLVGVLDHGARPAAYGASGCAYLGMAPGEYFSEPAGRVQWLHRYGGWGLPTLQTRLALVFTSETETAAKQRSRCASLPGFYAPALDVIAPSAATPFYTDWATQLGLHQAGLARSFDLCGAVGTDFSAAANGFALDWAQALQGATGEQ
jgi:hypothetical protein